MRLLQVYIVLSVSSTRRDKSRDTCITILYRDGCDALPARNAPESAVGQIGGRKQNAKRASAWYVQKEQSVSISSPR